MEQKIVFQIESNPTRDLDVAKRYPFAIKVSETNNQESLFKDHADYIKGVIAGTTQRDDTKYAGIKWNSNSKGKYLSGQDYVSFEPDDYGKATGKEMSAGQTAVFNVLKNYAVQNSLPEPEYVMKFDPATGLRASYDSVHINLP